MNSQFFLVAQTYNKLPCVRPLSYNITMRTTIHGATFLALSAINITLYILLIATLLYNWKSVFSKDFIYKLILIMGCIAVANAIVHFVMTVPCTLTGCLEYSARLMEFFTCLWETLEFGFFWTVFFISIDRFFTFSVKRFAIYFRRVSFWRRFCRT